MIIRFFQNYNRLERLKQIGAPDMIIDNEENRIQAMILQFLSYGFDVVSYMNSPKGSSEYLQWLAAHDHVDSIITKCHSCDHYSYIDNYWKCPLHGDNIPMKCPDYDDTGEDNLVRFMKNIEQRCPKCIHFFETSVPELEFKEPGCRLHLNMASSQCNSYKE